MRVEGVEITCQLETLLCMCKQDFNQENFLAFKVYGIKQFKLQNINHFKLPWLLGLFALL